MILLEEPAYRMIKRSHFYITILTMVSIVMCVLMIMNTIQERSAYHRVINEAIKVIEEKNKEIESKEAHINYIEGNVKKWHKTNWRAK